MAAQIERERMFIALTRPQMYAGVTWTFFVLNGILAAELFLIFKSFWVVPAAFLIHVAGVLVCLREPRFFDLWLTRVSRCPRIPNYAIWGCNSYRP